MGSAGENKSKFIGIAGGTASGKTTLANRLVELAPPRSSSIIYLDSYYHPLHAVPLSEREKRNYDHPDAFDFDLLRDHIDSLKNGKSVDVPVYDYPNHTRSTQTIHVKATPLIIVEGILTLFPNEIRATMAYSVFVHADAAVRLDRRIRRDTEERGRTRESVIAQWNATVEPMYRKFCEPARDYADLVIEGEGDYSEIAKEILTQVGVIKIQDR